MFHLNIKISLIKCVDECFVIFELMPINRKFHKANFNDLLLGNEMNNLKIGILIASITAFLVFLKCMQMLLRQWLLRLQKCNISQERRN